MQFPLSKLISCLVAESKVEELQQQQQQEQEERKRRKMMNV